MRRAIFLLSAVGLSFAPVVSENPILVRQNSERFRNLRPRKVPENSAKGSVTMLLAPRTRAFRIAAGARHHAIPCGSMQIDFLDTTRSDPIEAKCRDPLYNITSWQYDASPAPG